MNKLLPHSITIQNISDVRTNLLKHIKDSIVVELDFNNVKIIDISGMQLIISAFHLCEREGKDLNCKNIPDVIFKSIKKNGFNNDKLVVRFLKGE